MERFIQPNKLDLFPSLYGKILIFLPLTVLRLFFIKSKYSGIK